MNVLVLGGYGLIGEAVVRALIDAGCEVAGLGRSVADARRRCPEAEWLEADISRLLAPEDWTPLLAGFDAVVNCAGALQDTPRDDVAAVQRDAMLALWTACEDAGIARVVQVSAVGAAPNAGTAFMATKGEADAALASTTLDWVVLRPALVIAPTAYGATGLLRALAAMPGCVPLATPEAPVATVAVQDVAEAVRACLAGEVPGRTVYDLLEPQPRPLREVVAALRAWLGLAPARFVRVPDRLATLAFRIGDGLGRLGWRSPMRSTALSAVTAGITGDPGPWAQAGGTPPRPLERTLAAMPATVQERWFARIWLVRPAAIATLSLFWIVTGLVALLRADLAIAIPTTHGVPGPLAAVFVHAGAVADILLGAGVMVRRIHRAALWGMLALTAAYLVLATIVAPGLWLDPLGALVKAVPAAVLALFVLAVSAER